MDSIKAGDRVRIRKLDQICTDSYSTCRGVDGRLNGMVANVQDDTWKCDSNIDHQVWDVMCDNGNRGFVCEKAMERVEYIDERLFVI